MNYTYIIKCADSTLYTGWTNDLDKRKNEAMSREYAIKQLTRREKERLIKGNGNLCEKECG